MKKKKTLINIGRNYIFMLNTCYANRQVQSYKKYSDNNLTTDLNYLSVYHSIYLNVCNVTFKNALTSFGTDLFLLWKILLNLMVFGCILWNNFNLSLLVCVLIEHSWCDQCLCVYWKLSVSAVFVCVLNTVGVSNVCVFIKHSWCDQCLCVHWP